MSEVKKKHILEDPSNYWEQLERLDRLIRAAELKAGLIFSFHSLFIGVIIDKIGEVSKYMEGSLFSGIMVGLWFALVIVSLFYALRCFRPQMEMNFDTNAFFFIDANRNFGDVKGFRTAYREINQDPDQLYGQLAEQIYVHSKIIDFKFATVQKSLKFLSLSFFWLLVIVIVSLLIF